MKSVVLFLFSLLVGGGSLVEGALDSSLFTDCANTKTCFLVTPSDCGGQCTGPDCDLVAIIENIPSHKKFRIQLHSDRNYGYMAVGFSLNRRMEFSDVVGCDKTAADTAVVKDTYNIQGFFNQRDTNQAGISNFSYNISGSNFSCIFDRTYLSPPQANGYSLNESSYFLLLGTRNPGEFGSANGGFEQHSITPCISGSPANLLMPQPVESTARDFTFVKAHGLLMIFAWMVLIYISVFLASFTKHILPNGEWFHAHRLLNILALIIALVAFCLIFVSVGGWSTGSTKILAHQIFGIASIFVMLLNPLISYFRCKPKAEFRWVFNIIHRIVGYLGILIAFVAICLGLVVYYSFIGRNIYQAVALWIVIGWFAVALLFFIPLYLYCCIKCQYDSKREQDKLVKEKAPSDDNMLEALKSNFLCLPLLLPLSDRKKARNDWPFIGGVLIVFIACTLLFYLACVLTIVLI